MVPAVVGGNEGQVADAGPVEGLDNGGEVIVVHANRALRQAGHAQATEERGQEALKAPVGSLPQVRLAPDCDV